MDGTLSMTEAPKMYDGSIDEVVPVDQAIFDAMHRELMCHQLCWGLLRRAREGAPEGREFIRSRLFKILCEFDDIHRNKKDVAA
jgi:hypothetical protein